MHLTGFPASSSIKRVKWGLKSQSQYPPQRGEEFFKEVLFQHYSTLQGSKNFLPKKQSKAKQSKTI